MADNLQRFNDENFDQEVLKSDKPVMVDFYAEWCGPCKMLAPIIEELANETPNWKIGKLDTDASQKVAGKYGIQSIPTLLFFKDGQVIDMMMGFRPKESIKQKLG